MSYTLEQRNASRIRVFAWETFWLVGLWALAGLHFKGKLNVVPHLLGPMPTWVLWFGALGAVIISLSACLQFTGPAWDPRWELWHYSRPLIGATVAAISVLIFEAGIVSIGSDPTPSSSTTSGDVPKYLAYYLVAFLVGYREATFRELVKRLGDVVLKPADSTQPAISTITPSTGPVAGGQTVALTGTGLAQLVTLRVGATQTTPTELGDTYLIFTTPPAAGAGVVAITVETGSGTLATQYEYV
jgi:IPT/TIG domain